MDNLIDDKIDKFEAMLFKSHPIGEFPLKHLFLPGMYLRTIKMKKNSWVTSMVHNTVHPFFIKSGKVSVFSENGGEELLGKGFMGVTTPGTRRVLFMHETTVWTTIHPLPFITGEENSLSDDDKGKVVASIEDFILQQHVNPLLGGIIKNNVLTEHKIEGGVNCLS
jgi:hypothetical protein